MKTLILSEGEIKALRNLFEWVKDQELLKEQEQFGIRWLSFLKDINRKLDDTHSILLFGLN